jgi:hypothetical protein
MNPVEWQSEAEFVIASAEIEDVRLALCARLAERYGIRDGVFPIGIGHAIDYKTEPLHQLGVGVKDAQHLAALKYLENLARRASQEQFSWTRLYFKERLRVAYRGSSPPKKFVDKLLRSTVIFGTSGLKSGPRVAQSATQGGVRPALSVNSALPSTRATRRRQISPQSGRGLEILGHAIEYLADEYALQAGTFGSLHIEDDPQLQSIQILMAASRSVYYECPLAPTFRERLHGLASLREARKSAMQAGGAPIGGALVILGGESPNPSGQRAG